MSVWFSSDWHLSHANVIKYSGRPFLNVEEMNRTILDNFFYVVKSGDTFYHLGDLAWNKEIAIEFLRESKSKNIKTVLVLGNHDHRMLELLKQECNEVHEMIEIKVEGQYITLCHYAMRVWSRSHFGAWQLYGHSHSTLPPEGKQWDVGVDNNGFAMLSFQNVRKIMESQPNGFDFMHHNRMDA